MLLYGRKQVGYGTIKERDLEGSICAMPFNSSLTVSIKARFLSRILSATLIRHVILHFDYQLYAAKEEALEQFFSNISIIFK